MPPDRTTHHPSSEPAPAPRRRPTAGAPGVLLALAAVACGSASGPGSPASTAGAGQAPAPGPTDAGSAVPGEPEAADPQAPRAPDPGLALVIFGEDTVFAEVARTPAARRQGLMFRDSVPPGTGMLFVFDEPAVRSFWMQNTQVALDIAFIDEGLRVVEIERMEPETTDLHAADQPVLYALEVPAGWFAARGIRVGDRAVIVMAPAPREPRGPPRAPLPRAVAPG